MLPARSFRLIVTFASGLSPTLSLFVSVVTFPLMFPTGIKPASMVKLSCPLTIVNGSTLPFVVFASEFDGTSPHMFLPVNTYPVG